MSVKRKLFFSLVVEISFGDLWCSGQMKLVMTFFNWLPIYSSSVHRSCWSFWQSSSEDTVKHHQHIV